MNNRDPHRRPSFSEMKNFEDPRGMRVKNSQIGLFKSQFGYPELGPAVTKGLEKKTSLLAKRIKR